MVKGCAPESDFSLNSMRSTRATSPGCGREIERILGWKSLRPLAASADQNIGSSFGSAVLPSGVWFCAGGRAEYKAASADGLPARTAADQRSKGAKEDAGRPNRCGRRASQRG